MRIHGNQNVNMAFLAIRQSQNTKQVKGQNSTGNHLPGNRDTVTISLFGQTGSSQIKNLMSQKKSLLERKNELVSAACEDGRSRESIQSLLDSYEEQIKTLDQQISQEMSRQSERQIEKRKLNERDNTPKTKQEIENERLSNLINLSSGISQARTVRSVQTRIDGEANVLETEIELDKGRSRAGDSEGAKELIAEKEAKLADLRQQSNELTAKDMGKAAEVIEKTTEVTKETTEVSEKPTGSIEKTDESSEHTEVPPSEEEKDKNADEIETEESQA